MLALNQDYSTRQEGLDKIAAQLRAKYPNQPEVEPTITEAQNIFSRYFFPEMKTNWKLHPNNIGHKDFPGCFRCHDGEHKTADGKQTIKANDCNACHLILAEGRGADLEKLDPVGKKFQHPEEGWDELKCYDCHNGSVEEKK